MSLRNTVEHRVLPSLFYQYGLGFINQLLKNEHEIYTIFDSFYKEQGEVSPYQPEEFKINLLRLSEELFLCHIEFPTPQESLDCFHAYLYFKKDGELLNYYTVELGKDEVGDCAFICAWQQGLHVNYGSQPAGLPTENYTEAVVAQIAKELTKK